jgi:hypothetical protein
MSNKKHQELIDQPKTVKSKKEDCKKNKQQSARLIGDNKEKRKYILIGLTISVIAFIVFLILVFPQNKEDDVKEVIESDIVLSLVGEPVLVEDKMWNIWFDVSTLMTNGTMSFATEVGGVLAYNNETDEMVELLEVSTNDIEKYTFVWVFEKTNESSLADMTVMIENKTSIKYAGLYVGYQDNELAMFDRDKYFALKESE